jgi:hypothetical protein
MGLKDKINAALERANAGRQAKLGAKSDVAYDQGNLKKGARLDMRSKKVALRSEKRQAIGDAKNSMKIGKLAGKAINDAMRSSSVESIPVKPMIPSEFKSKIDTYKATQKTQAQQQEADALERAKKYKGGQY